MKHLEVMNYVITTPNEVAGGLAVIASRLHRTTRSANQMAGIALCFFVFSLGQLSMKPELSSLLVFLTVTFFFGLLESLRLNYFAQHLPLLSRPPHPMMECRSLLGEIKSARSLWLLKLCRYRFPDNMEIGEDEIVELESALRHYSAGPCITMEESAEPVCKAICNIAPKTMALHLSLRSELQSQRRALHIAAIVVLFGVRCWIG